jgi:hypothetical protein
VAKFLSTISIEIDGIVMIAVIRVSANLTKIKAVKENLKKRTDTSLNRTMNKIKPAKSLAFLTL